MDAQVPSSKLPNAVSVRSMASRVRPGSPALRRWVSPTPTFAAVLGRSPQPRDPVPPRRPFIYKTSDAASPLSEIEPSPAMSQDTFATSDSMAASSTVRLIPEADRRSPESPGSDESDFEKPPPSPRVFLNAERRMPSDRFSLVSELVSSYFAELENMQEYDAEAEQKRKEEEQRAKEEKEAEERKPQLSWFLTILVLLVVTVVSLNDRMCGHERRLNPTKQLVALNAEWMIDCIDSLSPTISKEWIALILLPTVGSLAGGNSWFVHIRSTTNAKPECVTATSASAKDRLSLSISVAVGSTIVSVSRNSGGAVLMDNISANSTICHSVSIQELCK